MVHNHWVRLLNVQAKHCNIGAAIGSRAGSCAAAESASMPGRGRDARASGFERVIGRGGALAWDPRMTQGSQASMI